MEAIAITAPALQTCLEKKQGREVIFKFKTEKLQTI